MHLYLYKILLQLWNAVILRIFHKQKIIMLAKFINYLIAASSNSSRLEAHAGIYRLLMKGIFDAYVLWPFDKKISTVC